MFAGTLANINEYAKGKLWYWHIPLWLFGLYIFVKLLGFSMLGTMPVVLLIPYSFDFVLHESAHLFTAFLPSVLTASAGSVSELLLGAGLVYGAFRFGNYFASLFCCLWCDLTCQSAGTYMADAIPQRLPLVSLGGALSGQDPIHDWHFVFGHLHMLGMSAFIGDSLRVVGHLVGLFGLGFSAWIMYKMAAAASEAASLVPKVAVTHHASLQHTAQPGLHPGVEAPKSSSIYPSPSKGALSHEPDQGYPPASTPPQQRKPVPNPDAGRAPDKPL